MRPAAIPANADQPGSAEDCLKAWIEAVNSGFADMMGELYLPDAVLLPTFDPKVLTTAAERLVYFINFKTRRGLKAAIDECHIKALDDNSSVASGLYTFRFLDDNGAEQTVHARFSFVFSRQPDGVWLIAAHHSSVAPES